MRIKFPSPNFNSERTRKILINSGFLLLLKIISLLSIIISVPITLNNLDEERYGLYMAITSILSFLNLADLGLGYGLQNSASINSDKPEKLRKDISNIFFLLLITSILALTTFSLLYKSINFIEFFNVKSIKAQNEVVPGVIILVFCFFIGLPFSIVQKVQIGMQKGYISTIWQITSSVLSLILVFWIARNYPSIPNLLFAVIGVNTIFIILNFLFFIMIKNKNLIPKISYFNVRNSFNIGKIGSIFFILQLLTIISTLSDSVIISHYKGAIHVTQYAIVQKLYLLLITPMQIFIEPLWPAYSDAISKNDIQWIKNTFNKSILLSLIASTFLSVILIFGGNLIINFWIKDNSFNVDNTLLIAFSSLIFYSSITGCFCTLLNSNEFLSKQLLFAIVTNLLCLAVKIFVIQRFDIWVLIATTFTSFALLFYLPNYIILKKYFNENIQ